LSKPKPDSVGLTGVLEAILRGVMDTGGIFTGWRGPFFGIFAKKLCFCGEYGVIWRGKGVIK